jgi:hypothetical protein
VEVAIGEWLRMKEPNFYPSGIFKLMPRWDKSVDVLRNYAKK